MHHLRRVVEWFRGWLRKWKGQSLSAKPDRIDKVDTSAWGALQLEPDREKMQEIGPDCWIENSSGTHAFLQGPLLTVMVPGNTRIKVHSPVLERVTLEPGNPFKMTIREWDALFVVQDMVDEYNRGIQLDQMTPDDLKHAPTLPMPRRSLGVVESQTKLRAYR